jgi:hypothetical protein
MLANVPDVPEHWSMMLPKQVMRRLASKLIWLHTGPHKQEPIAVIPLHRVISPGHTLPSETRHTLQQHSTI